MSAPLNKDEIKFRQRLLASAGFYTGNIDGVWGMKTDKAEGRWIISYNNIKDSYGFFDYRTEVCIETLLPVAQRLARLTLSHIIEARILSGTRTYTEQDMLYKQGRYGNKKPIVTNAKGGQSNHNFGIAWDIGIFKNGKYIITTNSYKDVGKIVIDKFHDEIEWGGNWMSFKDYPHYQIKTGMTLKQIRDKFEAGKLFL